jgi:hypothetical protein
LAGFKRSPPRPDRARRPTQLFNDPTRRLASDHYIMGGSGAIAVDVRRVSIDVEDFLAEAEQGMRLLECDHPHEACLVLSSA